MTEKVYRSLEPWELIRAGDDFESKYSSGAWHTVANSSRLCNTYAADSSYTFRTTRPALKLGKDYRELLPDEKITTGDKILDGFRDWVCATVSIGSTVEDRGRAAGKTTRLKPSEYLDRIGCLRELEANENTSKVPPPPKSCLEQECYLSLASGERQPVSFLNAPPPKTLTVYFNALVDDDVGIDMSNAEIAEWHTRNR